MWCATWNEHEVIVSLLLTKYNVDSNFKDHSDQTSLSWVTWNEHEAIVKLLLANVKIKSNYKNKYDQMLSVLDNHHA